MINQSRVNGKIKKILTILLFVLPAAVPLSIFWIYPMVKSIFISFTDWDYMSSIYNIVGLDNYKALASDEMFYQALKNTLAFMIGTVIPTIIIGLALAVLLKKSIKGGAFYKAIIFSPWITPTVAISIVWCWIFEPETGLANYILQLLSLPKSQWLQSSSTAMVGVIIVTVWKQVGWAMVFYLTALEKVPKSLYEACDVDGASKWKQFWKVTFPLVMPFVTINLILSTKNFLMVFDQILSLTKGGPAQSTESISYLIYKNGMDGGQFGFQSANAVLFFVVIVAISIFQMTVMGKKEEQL